MKNLFVIATVLLLTSCVTRKTCERKFPLIEHDSTRIVTNIVTVYRDTTVYIELPGDTIYKSIEINQGVSELRTPLANSYAWVKNGILEHRLEQKDSIVESTIKKAIKNTIKNTSRVKVLHQVRYMHQLTSWQRVQIYLGRVLISICFLTLVITFVRRINRM